MESQTDGSPEMNPRFLRTLAFVVLVGIVFVASCATFAQVG